jgi:hypothetical protein
MQSYNSCRIKNDPEQPKQEQNQIHPSHYLFSKSTKSYGMILAQKQYVNGIGYRAQK